MDYERKELVDWIRGIYQNLDEADKQDALRFFPELRESEDERMMREFNDWLCEEIECLTNDLRDEKDRRTLNMLCYILTKVKERLEKHKEQNHDGKKWIYEDEYNKELDRLYNDGKDEVLENPEKYGLQKEQKPIPDWMPRFLDELRSKKNYFDWDEHRDIEGHILAIINWIAPDYFKRKEEQKPLSPDEKMNHPLYLEGFDVGREVGKVEAEQKPAWSEEDEERLKSVIHRIEVQFAGNLYGEGKLDVDWLKSLRPSWKPSDEDEKILYAIELHINQLDSGETINGFSSSDMLRVLKSLRPSWKPTMEQISMVTRVCNNLHMQNNPDAEGMDEVLGQLEKL